MENKTSRSRRNFLLGASAIVGFGAASRWYFNRAPLEFAAIPGLNGWRYTAAGGVTSPSGGATQAVFAGIGEEQVAPAPASQLCDSLHLTSEPGVPVAIFSDFFCPNCPALEARLRRRGDLAITWHELPLLGQASEFVSRSTVAAELQGRRDFRRHLTATPIRPTVSNFVLAAREAGLDVDRFEADLNGPEVDRRLKRSRSIAETLRVWGTPAFVVGRTLALGALSEKQIDWLIDEERATGCGV